MTYTSDKRERLVEAAKRLIHSRGFTNTTLADIAKESEVPLGNVYYYFKTKKDLAEAVLSQRKKDLFKLYDSIEKLEDAKQRIGAYLENILSRVEELTIYGCPFGSLCQELNKDRTELADKADEMMLFQLGWYQKQFTDMGRSDSHDLAIKLVTSEQGAILLANISRDREILIREVYSLKEFVANL